jgi:hypothetical protein
MNTIAEFKEHLKYGIGKFGSALTIHVKEESATELRISLYTTNNVYHINAYQTDDGKYLGATMSRRMPNVGETHTRGSDIADGDLSLETWNDILSDIVSCELLEIKVPQIRTLEV